MSTTLEQRIAAALADNKIDSSALATLIAETEVKWTPDLGPGIAEIKV